VKTVLLRRRVERAPQDAAAGAPSSRAKLTDAATSSALAQRAITAGRLSCIELKTWRASS
jgi:hypothetical protein